MLSWPSLTFFETFQEARYLPPHFCLMADQKMAAGSKGDEPSVMDLLRGEAVPELVQIDESFPGAAPGPSGISW